MLDLSSERAFLGSVISNSSMYKTSTEIANKEGEIANKDAERFEIRPEIISLPIGHTVKMRAVAIPTPAQKLPNDPSVVWESSNPEVAF